MSSRKFKKIMTRPIKTQDSEVFMRPTFAFSDNIIKEAIFAPNNGKLEIWLREDELFQYMKMLAEPITQDSWLIKKHLQEFEVAASELKKSAADLVRASSAKNLSDILPFYNKYLEKWPNYLVFLWSPWAITFVTDSWLAAALQKKYKNWQEIYDSIGITDQPIQMQQLVEKTLAWKIRKGSLAELEKITDQYKHLGGYSVNDQYWTSDDVLDQIKQYKDPQADLVKMQQVRVEAGKKAQATLEKLKEDPQIHQVATTVHKYVYLRTERIDTFKGVLMATGPFYRRVEKELHLPVGWAAHLSCQEVIQALKDKKLPAMKDLSDRAHHQYALHITPERTKVISKPADQEKFLQKNIPGYGQDKRVSSLAGRVSYVGKVQGRARVIVNVQDVPTMRKGEILISNMTHPDYMPAIHKAKAIVTDEGGIVCHAAIMSRELKIPCVIGTSEATQTFKTGDKVEVDAEKGVVRKI